MKELSVQKVHVSWEDFGLQCDELILQIKKSRKKFKNVYGIPTGGNILANVLSNMLSIPIIYSEKKISKSTCIAEDISDSGKTLKKYKNKCGSIACLYSTKWTKVTPDFFVREKINEFGWIHFPWEK